VRKSYFFKGVSLADDGNLSANVIVQDEGHDEKYFSEQPFGWNIGQSFSENFSSTVVAQDNGNDEKIFL